jgi:hypothetical protein
VYALIVERLERHVIAERQVAAVMAAAGAKRVEVPTFDAERARLDRLLDDQPTPRRVYDPEQAALIAALGLGG